MDKPMKPVTVIYAAIPIFLFTGCATTYKDFKLERVKEGEGIAIGKINIKYNGENFNKNCDVSFGSKYGPNQKLTEEGLMFLALEKGETNISRIQCVDTSIHHYNISGATFTQDDGVTYFGQIEIEWTNDGGLKTSDLFGLIGAAVSESKNDGSIQMKVTRGDVSEIVKAYGHHTMQEYIKVTQSLAKSGK